MTSSFDVAVIGAGIAGLTTAALLQNDGARVLLLERHDKPGGCAGFFSLGRFSFDAGATVALGFEPSGLHRRVFDKLGVHDYDAQLLNGLRVHLPDLSLMLHHDAAKWRRERKRLPGNRAGQELFWRLQELVADAGWRALERLPSFPLQTARDYGRSLPLLDPRLLPMLPFLNSTMAQMLRLLRVENDRAFVALVNLLLIITVQEEAHRAPFTNGCSGLDLFRHGAYHLKGGMGEIARLLLRAFERDGGQVHLGEEVCQVTPRQEGFEIRTDKGDYTAQRVVANVPLQNVGKLVQLPPRALKNLTQWQHKAGEGWGAAMLYAALREDAVPQDAPLHQQVLLDYDAQPGDGRDVFLSLSQRGDLTQAPEGWRTLTVSTHARLDDWRDLSPQDYRAKKNDWREKLLDGVRCALPGFDAGRQFIVAGTPRTWEKYTNREAGIVGGVRLNLSNANLKSIPQRLGLRSFWLVGDSTFPGQGTVACALSGINAWRDISGARSLRS